MSTAGEQQIFIDLVQSKLTEKELSWLEQKRTVLAVPETIGKFPVFFSLAARFISHEIAEWSLEEINALEIIYPGFSKSEWTKLELVRVVLMITISPVENKSILTSFYECNSVTAIEAMTVGGVLLATKNCNLQEAANAGAAKISDYNVSDLIKSVNFLSIKKNSYMIRKKALNYAKRNLDINNSAMRILDFYKLIKNKS